MATRRIDKAKLEKLVGGNNRAVARKLAELDGHRGDRKAIDGKRRQLLKHLQADGTDEMTEKVASAYAQALGATPDDFLEPPTDPREAEIARLEERLKRLRAELSSERD